MLSWFIEYLIEQSEDLCFSIGVSFLCESPPRK